MVLDVQDPDQAESPVPFKGDILLVDDLPENLKLLSDALRRQGYAVRSAINASIAWMSLQVERPNLILLDVNMPEMNGFEFCAKIKADPKFIDIPIIFVSALGEVEDKILAFDHGGADYITKPFNIDEVLVRVRHQLHLADLQHQLEAQNESLRLLHQAQKKHEAKILALNESLEYKVKQRTQELETTIVSLQEEMKRRKSAQDESTRMAYYDVLTGLPNQSYLVRTLNEYLEQKRFGLDSVGNQVSHLNLAVLMIQFAQLQSITEALGHHHGDLLCKIIANRLVSVVPEDALTTHLGNGKFVVVLKASQDVKSFEITLGRICDAYEDYLPIEDYPIFSCPEIGVVLKPSSEDSPDHIIRDAELALTATKDRKQAPSWTIFTSELYQSKLDKFQIGVDLRLAIEREELDVHYQPIFDIRHSKIIGFEALLRWQHPGRGWISPGQFIPIAEETGWIVALGEWTLREACQQLQDWQTLFSGGKKFMSVNVSCIQFSKPGLLDSFDEILLETGISGRDLKLEVTESTVMSNPQDAIETLEKFRAKNIQISIDDFGTGYSSLSHLQKLPVNTLKIDRSFINGIESDFGKRQLVQSIVGLANTLQLDVIAEGVESQVQLDHLRNMGCYQVQGYLLGKPMPKDAIIAVLQQDM